MKNYFYAFKYQDGLNTTLASNPKVLAGDLLRFESKKERDAFVKANDFTHAGNLKPCHALNYKQARLTKYGFGIKGAFEFAM